MSDPATIAANGEDDCGLVDGGTGNGAGNAVRIVSDGPIGANQQADGDGGDSSVFAPRKEMSTVFGSALAAEYIAVVSPQDGVSCVLSTSSATIDTQLTSGDAVNLVTKGCFDCNNAAQLVAGGWKLSCTEPVWMYYEKESTDDETNVWGYKQMRQFVYPAPVVSVDTTTINRTDVFEDIDNFVWSSWFVESSNEDVQSPDGRYIQYRVSLNTSNILQTPTFDDIAFKYRVTALQWTDVELTDTLFTGASPFVCGLLTSSDAACITSLGITPQQLGNYSLRLQINSNDTRLDSINTSARNVSIFLQPTFGSVSADPSTLARGNNLLLTATLQDEAAQPLSGYNVSFVDETANGSRYIIGYNVTDGSGNAYMSFNVLNDSTFGTHTFNVSYAGDANNFIRDAQSTTTALVSSTPTVANITITPP